MISPNRLDSDAVKGVDFDQFRKGETMNNHEDLLSMDSLNLALFLGLRRLSASEDGLH